MSRDRGPSLFDVAESHKLPEQLTEKPPQTINSEPAYLVPDPELGPALDLSPDFHVPHLGETVDGIGVFVGSFIDEHGMTWWCFIEGCWRSLYDRPDAQWSKYRWADIALLESHGIEWRKYVV